MPLWETERCADCDGIVCPVTQMTYSSHGVPLEDYQLTRRDHQDQRTADQIREAVERETAKWRAEEETEPELREGRIEAVRRALEVVARFQPADREIMRWRVRLYCGHTVETRRHCTIQEPRMHGSSSQRCPECGKDPAYIVAYEPIATLDESLAPPKAQLSMSARPSRAQLERRVAELETEVSRLKSEMRRADGLRG
jgi:hypothetical protein